VVQPALPLGYQAHNKYQPPPLDYSPLKRFFLGILLGTGVSGIAYFGGMSLFNDNGDTIFMVCLSILAIKFIAFITCMFLSGWRTFGMGLLVSIALGFMIFFGVCTMSLGNMR